jgi:hypothetical protein
MVIVPRYPIRSGDNIEMITPGDVQVKQEVKLQALREEDKVILPPVKAQPPPTMQQILRQAPPRAQSREIAGEPKRWRAPKSSFNDLRRPPGGG